MRRSICLVPPALLAASLFVGCADSDDDGDDTNPALPTTGDPVANGPVANGPVADGPAADDPVADDPMAGDPVVNDPITGDPVTGDPTADDPDAEAPSGDSEPTPGPTITAETRERLVEEAFAIFSGEAWDTTPLSLPDGLRGIDGLFAPTDRLADDPDGNFVLVLAANCLAGSGRLEAAIPSGAVDVPWRARLDACTPDLEKVDLAFIGGSADGDWNRRTSARSDELLWTTASGERVSFSGEMRRSGDEFRNDNVASFITTDAHQSVRDDADGTLRRSIDAATGVRSLGSIAGTVDVASLSGGFTFRSDVTDGRAVTVRTPIELAYRWDVRDAAPDGVTPESLGEPPLGDVLSGDVRTEEQSEAVARVRRRWAFTVGRLELEAEDGSRLLLDADTGELDTVRMTLDEGRGEAPEERVVDWPDSWYRALAPDTLPSERAETTGEARRGRATVD